MSPTGAARTAGRDGVRKAAPPADLGELAALLDAAPGIHVVTEADGTIVDARGADLRVLGARRDDLRGSGLAGYILPASRPIFDELLAAGRSSPRELQLELHGGRRPFTAAVAVQPAERPARLCWTIVLLDRHESPAAEDAVAAAARTDRLTDVFERLHQGIVVVDRTLRVKVANTAARRLLASRLADGARLPAGRGFDLREIAAKAFAAREVVEVEVADGQRAYRIASIPPEGADDAAVLVVTDRTDQDRRERVERDFVAYASHELRTPLATISGAIEILQSGAKEIPDARDRFLRHIEREVTRLGRLVAALLVLARVQAGHELPEVGPVRVRPVLEEAAARLAVAPSVDVVVACPAQLAVVAHRDLLVEIMGNLGVNAAKYTDAGKIVFAALAQRDAVAIEVRDTGRGIPVEAQDLLFERFFRADDRKSDGFGLGLAIVREAVTALGGGVEIESAPGSGTTVRVVLPLATAEVGA